MTNLETQAALNKQNIKQHEDRIDSMEHHIEVTNKEMGELRDCQREMARDIRWLIKGFWWIIGVMLSGFGSLSALIIQHLIR